MLNSEPALSAACNQDTSASSYLSKVNSQLPEPNGDWDRPKPKPVVVTYSFDIPGNAAATEKRVIELSELRPHARSSHDQQTRGWFSLIELMVAVLISTIAAMAVVPANAVSTSGC